MISCLVSETHKLIFLWSPKAASTSVKSIFYDYMRIELPPTGKGINDKKWEEQLGFQKWDYPPNPSQYLKIQFVRNPYERAVSSFLHHLQYTKVHKNCETQKTFVDFLTSVKNNQIKCNGCKSHSRPQLVTYNIDEIVKIEKLSSELKRINEKYNLQLKNIIYDNHSYRRRIQKKLITKQLIAKKPIKNYFDYIKNQKQIIIEQPVKSYSDYLIPKAIELINQTYCKDIKHFGYEFR